MKLLIQPFLVWRDRLFNGFYAVDRSGSSQQLPRFESERAWERLSSTSA
jgi:hypothetical protein